jgi:hypothetical protein
VILDVRLRRAKSGLVGLRQVKHASSRQTVSGTPFLLLNWCYEACSR